ncbi:hypothetical protein E2C01_087818 [Portunus trituberculatus]|uniref:Uncharacterized protein n=1 Tax=Portunus trituberculatus TaxID=210409 RepID=A0A5B7J960_PORTR|nr:hypothetical protein [Portunus trituberculatus]
MMWPAAERQVACDLFHQKHLKNCHKEDRAGCVEAAAAAAGVTAATTRWVQLTRDSGRAGLLCLGGEGAGGAAPGGGERWQAGTSTHS